MQIIYRNVERVILLDKNGNEFELPAESFTEYDDDVRITSPFRSTDLVRGWVGDLIYTTTDGIEMKSGDRAPAVEETLHDVLLKSVLLTADRQNACDWEYVFLKK